MALRGLAHPREPTLCASSTMLYSDTPEAPYGAVEVRCQLVRRREAWLGFSSFDTIVVLYRGHLWRPPVVSQDLHVGSRATKSAPRTHPAWMLPGSTTIVDDTIGVCQAGVV